MLNNLNAGSMNMIDFRSFCIAMKAVWAYILYNARGETWNIIPLKYTEKCKIEVLISMNFEKKNITN